MQWFTWRSSLEDTTKLTMLGYKIKSRLNLGGQIDAFSTCRVCAGGDHVWPLFAFIYLLFNWQTTQTKREKISSIKNNQLNCLTIKLMNKCNTRFLWLPQRTQEERKTVGNACIVRARVNEHVLHVFHQLIKFANFCYRFLFFIKRIECIWPALDVFFIVFLLLSLFFN